MLMSMFSTFLDRLLSSAGSSGMGERRANATGGFNRTLGAAAAEAELAVNASLWAAVDGGVGMAGEVGGADEGGSGGGGGGGGGAIQGGGELPYEIRDTLWIVIPISIIYSTIFVVGVLGNVVTCVVISRNKSMHTATNYYLFSLAVSDLLLLLTGVPQEIYFFWYRYPYPFGHSVCIIASFTAESSANATVLTITAFTVERYVAICKPFLSHTMSRLSRAIRFVLVIWLVALSLAIPQALAVHIDEKYKTCTVRHHQAKPVFFVSTVIVFMFPMGVITVLYVLIWLQLRRSRLVRNSSQWGSSVQLKKRSIRKRRSHRTVVSLATEDRTGSPQQGSATTLVTPRPTDPAIVQPGAPPPSPATGTPPAIATVPRSDRPSGQTTSCPATPERRGLLGSHRPRSQRLSLALPMKPWRSGGSLNRGAGTSASTTAASSNSQLDQQPSGSEDDGRINYGNRSTQQNSTRHVVKMLVAVVIAFFLCWAPFHAQRLMAVYANEHNQDATIRKAFEVLTYASGILYYVSTCINPVLYNIMSHKFRQAFQDMQAHQCSARRNPTYPLSEDLFSRNVSRRSSAIESRTPDTSSTLRLGSINTAANSHRPSSAASVGSNEGMTTMTMTTMLAPTTTMTALMMTRRSNWIGLPMTAASQGREPEQDIERVVEQVENMHEDMEEDMEEAHMEEKEEPGPAGRPQPAATDNEPTEAGKPIDLCSVGRNVAEIRAPGPGSLCEQPARRVLCRYTVGPSIWHVTRQPRTVSFDVESGGLEPRQQHQQQTLANYLPPMELSGAPPGPELSLTVFRLTTTGERRPKPSHSHQPRPRP